MVIEEHIEIGVPPQLLFGLYEDVANWKCWDPDTASSSLNGPFRVGSTGRLAPTQGREVPMELVSVVPNRSFTAVARIPLCAMHFEHTLEPTPQGTRVTHRVSFSGPLAFLLQALVGPQISRGLPRTLRSLKHYAETGRANAGGRPCLGSVLVVLDLQNDFTQAQGKVPACVAEVDRIFAPINALIATWQVADQAVLVLSTRWGSRPMRWLTRGSVAPDSWGAELDGRLVPGSAKRLLKSGKSAFSSAEFVSYLDRTHTTELVLCGLAAEHCIAATAKDALRRGLRVVLVGDAIAAYRCQGAQKAFASLQSRGAQLVSAEQTCAG